MIQTDRLPFALTIASILATVTSPLIAAVHNVPVDHLTIQSCIEAAINGDECIVAPGTYNEVIDFLGKAITLRSENGAEATIIDGTGLNDSVVRFVSGEGPVSVLEGFTITGGTGSACTGPTGSLCGGGMLIENSSPVVSACIFLANDASQGGAINDDNGNALIIKCMFQGNSAVFGGGIYAKNSNSAMVNCTFVGNAAEEGGGVYLSRSTTMFTGCTFTQNSATTGGAVYLDRGSASLSNCIVWDDGADEIFISHATATVGFSDVMGGLPVDTNDGGGNIDADPKFLRPPNPGVDGLWNGTDDDYGDLRLRRSSLCIDAGDNSSVTVLSDANGDPRIIGGDEIAGAVVDMGAYEQQCVYIIASTENVQSGARYCTIQSAIDDAEAGDELLVSAGSYNEVINFLGKAITLRSRDGVESTIIDGTGLNSSVVIFNSEEQRDTILDGFTITGGTGSACPDDSSGTCGGGIYIVSSRPIIKNCRITNNTARFHGGGIYCKSDTPIIEHCAFIRNSTNNQGGAIFNLETSTILVDCKFYGNVASYGGAIFNRQSPTYIANCRFSGNVARVRGGGLHNESGASRIINCTFTSNKANFSSGLYSGDRYLTVSNSILWNNSPEEVNVPGVANQISYSVVQGSDVGTGNINANPLFIRTPDPGPDATWGTEDDDYGDLHILPASPCINKGNDYVLSTSITTDIDGEDRIQHCQIDIGADESPSIGLDCNNNGISDDCDIESDSSADCNTNKIPDECELADGSSTDCNNTNILDECEIADGSSGDCNSDGIPDECYPDCNKNGIADPCDIADSISDDCNGNGIPDECEESVSPVYVDDDAPPGGDGLSWATAFSNLQDALALPPCNDPMEIRVADGTYLPGTSREDTFKLLNNVTLLGGFAGFAEPDPDARDIELYETILSGDIGVLGDNADNSYHVVTGHGTDQTAILDGFTIRDGHADDSSISRNGGGMYNNNGSPTVNRCLFTRNLAISAGAMYNLLANPKVTGCRFIANEALISGGAVTNSKGSPTFTECTFIGNSAQSSLGGALANAADTVIERCIFMHNTAKYGGGVYAGGIDTTATVIDCEFIQNTAESGGGAIFSRDGDIHISNSTFTGNSAGNYSSESGGGAYYTVYGQATITNSNFVGNSAPSGGGIKGYRSQVTLHNNTFTQNVATIYSGGAIYTYDFTLLIYNSIFWNDSPQEILLPGTSGSLTVRSSNVNGGHEGEGNIDIDPLFVRNPSPGPDELWGTDDDDFGDLHLLPESPCVNAGNSTYVPADVTTDIDGDSRIQHCQVDMGADETDSPGSDCNDNSVSDACDIEEATSADCNTNRIPDECEPDCDDDGIPDVCDVFAGVLFVDDDAPPGSDGQSWETALNDLQDAIAMADCLNGAEIRVAAGTYVPGIEVTDDFRLRSGVSILGGYAGYAASDPSARDIELYETVLSGDVNGDDGPNFTNYSDNCRHIVTSSNSDSSAVLDGLTISGSYVDSYYVTPYGGAMFNWGGSPTIRNCTFTRNRAHHGSSIYNGYSNPTVTNCRFIDNYSFAHGGAVYNQNANPIIKNCTFSGNKASLGGALYNHESAARVTGCRFDQNTAFARGGGIYNNRGSPVITNCTFVGHRAYQGAGMQSDFSSASIIGCVFIANKASLFTQFTGGGGGGMSNYGGEPRLTHCTFSGNTGFNGGAILNYNSRPVVIGCILWGNVAEANGQQISNATSSVPEIFGSLIEGSGGSGVNWDMTLGSDNGNNIDIDPSFIRNPDDGGDGWGDDLNTPDLDESANDDLGDLRLSIFSPAVDAGHNNLVPIDIFDLDNDGNTTEPLPYDAAGNPRFVDAPRPDSGFGIAPIVDLGAYEYNNDCNDNDIPDEEEIDSDNDGVIDECDICNGFNDFDDADMDGVSDECDACRGFDDNSDADNDGIIDGCEQPLIFVDAAAMGTDDGSSWTDAHRELQTALAVAHASKGEYREIWVAAGTYTPDRGAGQEIGDPLATFSLADGVTIYGGFLGNAHAEGGELSRDERDPATNITILSGDLNDDDVTGNNLENSTHVVTAQDVNNTARLDGFTIRDGKATQGTISWGWAGGGLLCHNASPLIVGCTFTQNLAIHGGGVANAEASSSTFINCRFFGNEATNNAGAMYNSTSNTAVINGLFHANAAWGASAIMNRNSSPSITNCTFFQNRSLLQSGMIYNFLASSPTISNCILWDNPSSGDFLQIHNRDPEDKPTIVSSLIQASGGSDHWDTKLGIDGGGNIDRNPYFIDSRGADNISGTEDDDLQLMVISPAIDAGHNNAMPPDSLDLDNDGDTGEPVPIDLDRSPRFIDALANDTGSGNAPIVDMGAYEYTNDCNQNGISDDQETDADGDLVIDSCDICPGVDDFQDRDGDTVPDPCDACPGFDDRQDADNDGTIDGCEQDRIYVDTNALGVDDGSSWENAHRDLTTALAVASAGGVSEIWVAAGTYVPTRRTNSLRARSETFELPDGVSVYGGFLGNAHAEGGESDLKQRDTVANVTVLSGDQLGDDVDNLGDFLACFSGDQKPFEDACAEFDVDLDGDVDAADGGLSDNSYHVVVSVNTNLRTILDGFTITAGNANGFFSQDNIGGGLINLHGDLKVSNCTFRANTADAGGGMYNSDSNLTVSKCKFSENTALIRGGGLYNTGGKLTVNDCTFTDNLAVFDGGGMRNFETSATVNRCTFVRNKAIEYGGGVASLDAMTDIQDCVFNENHANYGGGLACDEDTGRVTDSSFVGNDAYRGGGMYLIGDATIVSHNLFERNTAVHGGGMGISGIRSLLQLIITDCRFVENIAQDLGGGLLTEGTDALIKKCIFERNIAARGAGAINDYYSSAIYQSCSFFANVASVAGGGMGDAYYGNTTVHNCIFVGNSAPLGGAIDNRYGDANIIGSTFVMNIAHDEAGGILTSSYYTTVSNSILWANIAPQPGAQFSDRSSGNTPISYCNIQGTGGSKNWTSTEGLDAGGNIDIDPMFVRMPDDGGDGWSDNPDTLDIDEGVNDDFGDLHLLPGSPAINTGDPDFIPDALCAADFDDKPRVICGRVDMGAYESGHAGDIDCDETVDVSDYLSWPDCMTGPADDVLIDPACYSFDVSPDARIDLKDFAVFSRLLTPP